MSTTAEYGTYAGEQISAQFERLQSANPESKVDALTVSYDGSGGDGYGTGISYYVSGSTVYVTGVGEATIDLSSGLYGAATNIDATASYGANNYLFGNYGSNIIVAGSGNNGLWGGYDYADDILVGNTGTDIFVYYKSNGNDTILNASLSDTVLLLDTYLSDIVYADGDGAGNIALVFNTGTVLQVQCADSASPDFVLADDSVYWYGNTTGWHQTA